MRIIITSPSSDISENVSGVAAVTRFIVNNNARHRYEHFVLGKRDNDGRDWRWLLRTLAASTRWVYLVALNGKRAMIHFNLALDYRGLLRDLPLIGVSRLFRRRIIVHIHGGEFISGAGMPRWLRAMVRVTLAHVPIIVLSQKEKSILERIVGYPKVFVLPNGIDIEEAAAFQRSTPHDEQLVILFLGRIAVSKGIDLIFRSLEILKTTGVDFRLVMAGAGPEEAVYVSRFRQLLSGRFSFHGVVGGVEKIELLKKSNVFLLPSQFEGLPIALLESMAFGLVPITTDVGSISTVLKDGQNGILIDAEPAAIASALRKLSIDRAYRHSLSENGRNHILSHFGPEGYMTRLNEIYEYE